MSKQVKVESRQALRLAHEYVLACSPYYSGAHRALPQAVQGEHRRRHRRWRVRGREAARFDLCEARGPRGVGAARRQRNGHRAKLNKLFSELNNRFHSPLTATRVCVAYI